jgi:DNA invertase Pin-like site-specific DNA recombinase
VIVWDYARLARDMTQLDEITSQLRAHGVDVITSQTSVKDFVLLNISRVVAEWYRDEQSVSVKADIARKRAAHTVAHSTEPKERP